MSAGANSLDQKCKDVEQFNYEVLVLLIKQDQVLCIWQSRQGKRLTKAVFNKGVKLDILQGNADHWPDQVQKLTHVAPSVDLLLVLMKLDKNKADKVIWYLSDYWESDRQCWVLLKAQCHSCKILCADSPKGDDIVIQIPCGVSITDTHYSTGLSRVYRLLDTRAVQVSCWGLRS